LAHDWLRLPTPRYGCGVPRFIIAAALGLVVMLAWRHHHSAAPALRFATFNIEDFPKNARQIQAAFDEIERLDAAFVAVQEILDPRAVISAARDRLGPTWRFVEAEPGVSHDLGLIYDARRFALVTTTVHDETRLGRNKPVFEVRLAPAGGGTVVRVLVVHLRCCSEGRDTRVAQHAALRGIVERAQASGDRIVVLGDFNATAAGDRSDLATLAHASGLVWASEGLACSAFWRRVEDCPRSRLDHVLTWAQPATVAAAGACATEGCDTQDRCPLYVEQVSDHCPVVVTMP
jgi:endonuclease/exonuclease/phosphatase family metal-dependent hydrolase